MEVFVVTNRGSSFLLIQVQLVQLIRLTIHNCSNESIVFKTEVVSFNVTCVKYEVTQQ